MAAGLPPFPAIRVRAAQQKVLEAMARADLDVCWSPPTAIFGISTGQHGFECTSHRSRDPHLPLGRGGTAPKVRATLIANAT